MKALPSARTGWNGVSPPLRLSHHQCTEEDSLVLPSLIGAVPETSDEQFSDSLRSFPSGEKGRRAR